MNGGEGEGGRWECIWRRGDERCDEEREVKSEEERERCRERSKE